MWPVYCICFVFGVDQKDCGLGEPTITSEKGKKVGTVRLKNGPGLPIQMVSAPLKC